MTRPTFLEGVGIALLASVIGAVAFSVLTTTFAGSMGLKVLVASMSFGYVCYLLRRSPERIGRVVSLAGWLAGAVAAWWLAPSIAIFAAAHVAMIWLVRSLYFHASALSTLADLVLNGVALGVAVWAAVHSHSVALSVWCFFLVQALFVAIPRDWRPHDRTTAPDDRFERAHQAAQTAVRNLSTIH